MTLNSKKQALCISFTLLSVLILTQGCTRKIPPSYNPLPSQLESQVQMPGLPNVRAWGDVFSLSLEKSALASLEQEKAAHHGKLASEISALALSGGGQDGAFGAGLLCGWTKAGTRPSFKLVTGISTGALIAPFAFLGPAYDAQLKQAYTTVSDNNIYKVRSRFSILLAISNIKPLPSAADDKGLALLIEKFFDEAMLKKIATEHLKGRRLLVGTTQLNAQRLVIWDMGAIAASHSPQALKLFQKILLASASVPVTFPPQYFKVEAEKQLFDEMHVDGGIETEVMLFENALKPFSRRDAWFKDHRPIKLYIVRNQKVTPEWQYVIPDLKHITIRSLNSLTKSQGISDLYRLYVYAGQAEAEYNLASIPIDFTQRPASPYDKIYMNQLFERGFSMGKAGYAWHKYPPNFTP